MAVPPSTVITVNTSPKLMGSTDRVQPPPLHWTSFIEALAPGGPVNQRRHGLVGPGFIDEDEVFESDLLDVLVVDLSQDFDAGSALLGGNKRFFLRVSLQRCQSLLTVERSMRSPVASNSASANS